MDGQLGLIAIDSEVTQLKAARLVGMVVMIPRRVSCASSGPFR